MVKFQPARNHIKIDPIIQQLTHEKLKTEIEEYKALLDDKVNENRIHAFLATHSYFFNGLLRMFGESPLYSKVKLGNSFEVDFAWFDTSSDGPEWSLAEIESPQRQMFTKLGEPTAWLNHAIQQVSDWHSWIHENLDFARKSMPRIEYPRGFVFIGRRSELTDISRKRLKRICYEHRKSVEIHTLDWFISAAWTVDNLIGSKGGGWDTPSKALTQSDLAHKLPASAFEWLESDFAISAKQRFQEARLEEREQGYLDNEDLFDR